MKELIIPFINKQVIHVHKKISEKESNAILNLSTATYLTIFRTERFIPVKTDEEKAKATENIQAQGEVCTKEIIDRALSNKISPDSNSLLQNQFIPAIKQVFVIMKFKDAFLDSAYEGVIKPIIKKFKYKALRIDEIQDSGKITDQILSEISRSEIVFADLSGERPNCYYEAGFAHAIGKEMIFTVRKGTPIHFDLFSYRFIEWETEDDLRQQLNRRFKSLTKEQSM